MCHNLNTRANFTTNFITNFIKILHQQVWFLDIFLKALFHYLYWFFGSVSILWSHKCMALLHICQCLSKHDFNIPFCFIEVLSSCSTISNKGKSCLMVTHDVGLLMSKFQVHLDPMDKWMLNFDSPSKL